MRYDSCFRITDTMRYVMAPKSIVPNSLNMANTTNAMMNIMSNMMYRVMPVSMVCAMFVIPVSGLGR